MTDSISYFNGGLKNKLHPVFINSSEAVDLLNVKVDDGLLTNCLNIQWRETNVPSPQLTIKHDLDTKFITSDTNTIVKSLHARLYSTNIFEDTPLTMYANGTSHQVPMSIVLDQESLILTYSTFDSVMTIGMIQDYYETNSVQGKLDIAITVYDVNTGYESAPVYKTIAKPLTIRYTYDVSSINFNSYIYTMDEHTKHIKDLLARGVLEDKGVDTSYVTNNATGELLVDLTAFVEGFRNVYDMFNSTIPTDATLDPLWQSHFKYSWGDINRIAKELNTATPNDIYNYIHMDILYDYLHRKGADYNTNTRFFYYVPTISTIHIECNIPENKMVRVYRRGKLGLNYGTDEYQLIDSYTQSPINIAGYTGTWSNGGDLGLGTKTWTNLQSVTFDDRILTSIDTIDSLAAGPFAVSTSNLWVTEFSTHRLWYSELGSKDLFRNLAYVSLPSNITGVHYINNGIQVFCEDSSVHFITGSKPIDIKLTRIADDVDCIDARTISRTTNQLVWLTAEGLAISNGYSIQLVGRDSLKPSTFGVEYINESSLISSASIGNTYYVLINGKLYSYDFRHDRLLIYSIKSLVKIWEYKGYVYGHNGANKYGKLFTGEPETLYYKTKSFVKPKFNVLKEYARVFITYKGSLNLEIYIDDVLVNTVSLHSESINRTHFQVQQSSVGYEMHAKFRGICTVYDFEVEYSISDNS